jgi:prepilin-type processing-associated H-X9-DG protein
MQGNQSPSNGSAFSLLECLVVLATLGLLLLPCLGASSNRARTNRLVCLNNLRQMGLGSQMYAAEDPKGRLAGNLAYPAYTSPGDDLNWLYGYGPSRTRLVPDLKTFLCPATHNSVRPNLLQLYSGGPTVLTDLFDNGRTPFSYGHSYEVSSRWSEIIGDKTLQSTATFKKTRDPLAGTRPGPSMIMLIFDAMDAFAGPGSVNDYPNPYVGHGAEGGNMLFCDGHAEWIETRNWLYRYNVSQDTQRTPP